MGNKNWFVAAVGCLIATPMVWAGPDHVEGDAGSKRSTAEIVSGAGPLGSISGTLASTFTARMAPDFEDMYLIQIDQPSIFLASTFADDGGIATFDTQLWLFSLGAAQSDAFGLLANDDIELRPPGPSIILPNATDASGAQLINPGLYLIAITGSNRDPVSENGAIFNQALTTEISGPDGVGGAQSHIDWNGAGEVGSYKIVFVGASFVDLTPIPTLNEWGMVGLTALLMTAGVIVLRRRAALAYAD